jgi:MFS transporter, PPP family, 3-phenylpropionic acid transporter
MTKDDDRGLLTNRTPGPSAVNVLPGYLMLYIALYSAYGTESAYLPAFLGDHGLSNEQIGLALAAGTIVRIVAGPLTGRLADHLDARKQVLSLAAFCSGLIGFAYNLAFGFAPLLTVSMAHAAATASLAPLADALSVAASIEGRGFQYGWVRGAGSAAFVCGTLVSGQLIDRFGLRSIIVASSILFLLMTLSAIRIRPPLTANVPPPSNLELGVFATLWKIVAFKRLIVIAFLVIGSHALNDAFAVIQWREAGHSNLSISLLWSEAVVAEVVVFFLLGPWLIARLGLSGAARLSAAAGVLRWSVMASTTAVPALVGVQALHGLTFALMHLAAMGIIARSVPTRLAATAQTLYGTGALGIASATMTFASGYLYGLFALRAFWAMAACCGIALLVSRRSLDCSEEAPQGESLS